MRIDKLVLKSPVKAVRSCEVPTTAELVIGWIQLWTPLLVCLCWRARSAGFLILGQSEVQLSGKAVSVN